MTAPRRAQPQTPRHLWPYGLVTLVGLLLPLVVLLTWDPPAQTPAVTRTVKNVTASPVSQQTWRPAVKVDWKKHPKAQARIDRLGQRGDCDALAAEIDKAVREDPRLVAYVYAWAFEAPGSRCVDVYYNKDKEVP